MYRFEKKPERALKFFDDGLGEDSELNVGMFIVEVLGKLSDAFRVRLRLESETLALEKGLQLLVIRDDAVVNYRKFPVRVGAVPCTSVSSVDTVYSRITDM